VSFLVGRSEFGFNPVVSLGLSNLTLSFLSPPVFYLRDLGKGGKISISSSGKFLACDPGGALHCNRRQVKKWEEFRLVPVGRGKFAIRCHNNRYICAEGGGGGGCIGNRASPNDWESFVLLDI
jgi:hypothetical protein